MSADGRTHTQRAAGRGKRSAGTVRAVERAAGIMDALWCAPGGKRLGDLSEELGLHKTTVLRLLRTLVAIGVAHRDEANDLYRCSPISWLGVSHDLREMVPQVDTVQKILEDLAEATEMMAGLATPVPERRMILYTAWVTSGAPMCYDPRETRSGPMHASATGKTYLASLSRAELEEWMRGGLAKFTEHTITSPERLKEELAEVRRQGYALSREEWMPGIFIVAVPVRGAEGRTVASLALGTESAQIMDTRLRRLVRRLRGAAERLSNLLVRSRPYAGAG